MNNATRKYLINRIKEIGTHHLNKLNYCSVDMDELRKKFPCKSYVEKANKEARKVDAFHIHGFETYKDAGYSKAFSDIYDKYRSEYRDMLDAEANKIRKARDDKRDALVQHIALVTDEIMLKDEVDPEFLANFADELEKLAK